MIKLSKIIPVLRDEMGLPLSKCRLSLISNVVFEDDNLKQTNHITSIKDVKDKVQFYAFDILELVNITGINNSTEVHDPNYSSTKKEIKADAIKKY